MSNNVVDILRDKNDEADLDRLRKPQMGGYTKKSDQDYVAQLKRQQQKSAETFNRDMQSLLDEKEQLLSENSKLKTKLTKAVTDYKTLSDNVASVKAGESALSVEDILKLRNHVRVLEKDKQDALTQVKQHERTLEQKQHVIGEKNRQIDQYKQESAMYQGMLAAARTEAEDLRSQISAQATQIEQFQGEVNFLKAMVNDGNVAKLNGRIDELTVQMEQLNAELAKRVQELQASMEQVAVLKGQQEVSRQVNDNLRASLEQAVAQNEKMEAANAALNQELERQMKESLQMLRAQSDLKVENAILTRKLDAEKVRGLVANREAAGK